MNSGKKEKLCHQGKTRHSSEAFQSKSLFNNADLKKILNSAEVKKNFILKIKIDNLYLFVHFGGLLTVAKRKKYICKKVAIANRVLKTATKLNLVGSSKLNFLFSPDFMFQEKAEQIHYFFLFGSIQNHIIKLVQDLTGIQFFFS